MMRGIDSLIQCCIQRNDGLVTVMRGIDSLIQCCIQRNERLADLFRTKTPVIVYTYPTIIARLSHSASGINVDKTEDVSVLNLRSTECDFDFRRDCLFCADETFDKVRVKQRAKYI